MLRAARVPNDWLRMLTVNAVFLWDMPGYLLGALIHRRLFAASFWSCTFGIWVSMIRGDWVR